MFRRAAALPFLALLASCNALPTGRAPERIPTGPISRPAVPPEPTREARRCIAELGESGTRFAVQPDAFYGAGCSTINTVRIEGLTGDAANIAVTNLGAVTCPLAQTFAGWARYGVDRAARQILGSSLIRIETMGSYSCRNVAGTGRRSAHARAEAIDVAAFVLADGRRVSVLSDWNAPDANTREFLRTIQRSACKRFGTVLGPDYNAAHANHFHLEEGNGSFCR
ncbi:MAG: extensin family protein [Erythrobacter sp.]|nr:extensin family protein [Erythrobacter sp.]